MYWVNKIRKVNILEKKYNKNFKIRLLFKFIFIIFFVIIFYYKFGAYFRNISINYFLKVGIFYLIGIFIFFQFLLKNKNSFLFFQNFSLKYNFSSQNIYFKLLLFLLLFFPILIFFLIKYLNLEGYLNLNLFLLISFILILVFAIYSIFRPYLFFKLIGINFAMPKKNLKITEILYEYDYSANLISYLNSKSSKTKKKSKIIITENGIYLDSHNDNSWIYFLKWNYFEYYELNQNSFLNNSSKKTLILYLKKEYSFPGKLGDLIIIPLDFRGKELIKYISEYIQEALSRN